MGQGEERMRFYIDMDGTIADLVTPWLEIFYQQTGRRIRYDEVVGFGFPGLFTQAERAEFFKIPCIWGVYKNLDPVDGAIGAIDFLSQAGHEIYFATRPFYHSPYCCFEKYEWIENHFPGLENNIIFTKNKGLLDPANAVLIDDYEDNLKKFEGQKILFDQPWNRHVVDYHRARNWQDIVSLFKNE